MLRLKEDQYISELVVHCARRKLLRIAQGRSEAQKIFALNFLEKDYVARLQKVAQGDAIPKPGFSLPSATRKLTIPRPFRVRFALHLREIERVDLRVLP